MVDGEDEAEGGEGVVEVVGTGVFTLTGLVIVCEVNWYGM